MKILHTLSALVSGGCFVIAISAIINDSAGAAAYFTALFLLNGFFAVRGIIGNNNE